MTPHAENDAEAVTLEFKAVPEFVAMGKEERIASVHAKVSAACGWSVIALEMLALDKAELVESVIAADCTTAGTIDGMMNELQAAIEAGDCLFDTMKWAQARLVVALSAVAMHRRH
jgi:uncharacterized membrane protein YjfL (UPF0719 family)